MARALELTGMRILRTDWPSDLFNSLNPEENLDFNFTSHEITILWFGIKKNPISLSRSLGLIKSWIRNTDPLYEYLGFQYCHDTRSHFNLDSIPSVKGDSNLVTAKDWAHLLVHLSLIHAPFTATRSITNMFEDRVFYNPANSEEICIVYNYPTNLGQLGTYLEHIQNYMHSLVIGKPDEDFLNWLEGHRYIYDQFAENRRASRKISAAP